MVIRRHQELVAWQFARRLERQVYAFTAKRPVRKDEDYCRQIRRSASSAPRNMAEGFGRFWPGEFAHKLRIALGELRETQDHLDKGLEEKYVTEMDHADMRHLADRAIGAATNFIKYLDRAGPDWKKNFLARQRKQLPGMGTPNPELGPEGTKKPRPRGTENPRTPRTRNPRTQRT